MAASRPGQGRRQAGAALLLFLLVLVVLSAGQLLRKLNHGMTSQSLNANTLATHAALLEAKRAVLGYAAVFAAQSGTGRGPGRLPCAAVQADREAESACGGAGGSELSVGLLPYSRDPGTRPTMPNLLDGSGTPLIYILDGSFRRTPPPLVNVNTVADITLNGQSGFVALVFAPGSSMLGQSRPTGSANVVLADFLEDAENRDGDLDFILPSNASNDALITITREDLLCAIRPVVRSAAAQVPTPPAWYASEGWDAITLAALNLLVCPLGGLSNASSP